MCVAVPGQVRTVEASQATVDVGGGATVNVRMDLVPDASPGDWVLVHAGFALDTMDEAEAFETRRLLAEADALYRDAVREERQ